MATTYHKFTGKCQWAKLAEDTKDQVYEKYSVDIFLDAKELKRFNALKLRTKLKMNEEGQAHVTFSRPFTKTIKNELQSFGPPAMFNSDGVLIENDKPLIGNGSILTVKIAVYDTAFEGKPINGCRLEAVKIEELVEYVKGVAGDPTSLPF